MGSFFYQADVNKFVDLTLVDPRATSLDVEKLCEVAIRHQYHGICINSCNVAYAKGYLSSHDSESIIHVSSTIAFPLGAISTKLKLDEIDEVEKLGVSEIDVVINIGQAKGINYRDVTDELLQIRRKFPDLIIKAVIEVCYFDTNEIIRLCHCCIDAKVNFIETSTGFGSSGFNEEIIRIMLAEVKNSSCLIKVSGGIYTKEQAVECLNMGVKRIGTSFEI